MELTLTPAAPVMGPVYDRADPDTRQPWLDFRQGGITATEIRDWRQGSKRRAILAEKVTGHSVDLSGIPAFRHGTLREPMIADWAHAEFEVTPTGAVFHHPDNPRYLASPDGVTLDPFTGALVAGTPDAAVLEIKTATEDLTPGPIGENRVLRYVEPGSLFDRHDYYAQVQWQMFVMNAAITLFVWERHNGQVDPETGTYTPVGPPEYVWIERDQDVIDALVEMADDALAQIDAARLAARGDFLPEASDLPVDDAILAANLLAARDAVAVAEAARDEAFKALQERHLGGDDKEIKGGFVNLTVSTSSKITKKFDEAAAREANPEAMAAYDHLVKKFTTVTTEMTQRLTVTRPKS